MLTVMMICVIMASMLLPALGKAQAQAQSVSCLSNLRQLGMSFFMYAQDNRNRFPPYVENSVYLHGGTNWARYTFMYHNDASVLDCPVSPQGAPEPTTKGLHLYDGNYGWNYDGTQANRGPVFSIVAKPARCHLVFDSGDQCLIYGANNWNNLMEELDLDWDSRSEGPNRHNNRVNVTALDGHTESSELLEFIGAPSDSFTSPWYMEWQYGRLERELVSFPER